MQRGRCIGKRTERAVPAFGDTGSSAAIRSDLDRLHDINEAIRRIGEKLPLREEEFLKSDLLQVWVLYHIQIIGEAANSITPGFQNDHKEIPWKDIIAMRHLLVHQYFGIDLGEVWSTAHQDLPRLRQQVSLILKRG
jgi:uncharacterized protein with HEPN domain